MNSLISNFKNHKFMTIKTHFNIRKLKRLLNKYPIEFDNLDRENIEKVINSNIYNDGEKPLNGFNHTMNANDIVNTIIDFYYSISSEMGDTIKKLYNTHKDKICIEQPQDACGNTINTKSIASGGVTFNPNMPKKKKMPDGTEKDIVCDIELCQNYTTYYTVAHEFMHLMERSVGNSDEKLAEVNTRFIEYLLGEYLVEKGIITQKDVDDHNWVNNNQKQRAYQLKDIEIIMKMIKNHSFTQKKLRQTLKRTPEQLYNNIIGIITSITGEEINRPKNNLRFINGMVGANKLLEIYNRDKENFRKVYGRIMSTKYQGKFDFKHFFTDLETNIALARKEAIVKTNNIDEPEITQSTVEYKSEHDGNNDLEL